jgi:hypothetical protein
VAKRVEWFKTLEEALADRKHFLAHLMTYGTWDDLVVAARYYSEAEFEAVLGSAGGDFRPPLVGLLELALPPRSGAAPAAAQNFERGVGPGNIVNSVRGANRASLMMIICRG